MQDFTDVDRIATLADALRAMAIGLRLNRDKPEQTDIAARLLDSHADWLNRVLGLSARDLQEAAARIAKIAEAAYGKPARVDAAVNPVHGFGIIVWSPTMGAPMPIFTYRPTLQEAEAATRIGLFQLMSVKDQGGSA